MSRTPNAWETPRPRQTPLTAHNPQDRSSTASPAQQANATTAPASTKQQSSQHRPGQTPTANAWNSNRGNINGNSPIAGGVQAAGHHVPVNGFNSDQVRSFLSREDFPALYKPNDGADKAKAGVGAGVWVAKPNTMGNGQLFFVQLAKQVAASHGGG